MVAVLVAGTSVGLSAGGAVVAAVSAGFSAAGVVASVIAGGVTWVAAFSSASFCAVKVSNAGAGRVTCGGAVFAENAAHVELAQSRTAGIMEINPTPKTNRAIKTSLMVATEIAGWCVTRFNGRAGAKWWAISSGFAPRRAS